MFKINVQLPFILFLTVQDFFSQSLHDDLRSGGHFCCSCFPSLIRWPSLWNLLQVATYLCLVLSSRDTWIFSNALDLNFEEWLRLCLSPTDVRECASNPCQNGGTCVEGVNHYRCTCPQSWSGSHCQHQTQTGQWAELVSVLIFSTVKPSSLVFFSSLNAAPPEWSVMNDPAFSRRPRCAQVNQAQHCSCDAGFHMSGTSDNSICQGEMWLRTKTYWSQWRKFCLIGNQSAA